MSSVPFESRYTLIESNGSPIASGGFLAAGTARQAILVVGHGLAFPVEFKVTAAGFAVQLVRTIEAAKAFLAARTPTAIVLSLAEKDALALVRFVRDQPRLTFVQIFLTPPGPSIAAAIRSGVDDVFEVVDDDAIECIMARIDRAETLAQLALLDPLTQLHNHRFMNDRLQSEIARAHRSGAVFALALVDLDDFQVLNDTFGHTAGDRMLSGFARVLRRDLRPYDVTCRFGADEFIVLFPDCDAPSAHNALAKLGSGWWDVPGLPVMSFSAGIAEFPEDGDSWTTLFDVADCTVRAAKQDRRNRMAHDRQA